MSKKSYNPTQTKRYIEPYTKDELRSLSLEGMATKMLRTAYPEDKQFHKRRRRG